MAPPGRAPPPPRRRRKNAFRRLANSAKQLDRLADDIDRRLGSITDRFGSAYLCCYERRVRVGPDGALDRHRRRWGGTRSRRSAAARRAPGRACDDPRPKATQADSLHNGLRPPIPPPPPGRRRDRHPAISPHAATRRSQRPVRHARPPMPGSQLPRRSRQNPSQQHPLISATDSQRCQVHQPKSASYQCGGTLGIPTAPCRHRAFATCLRTLFASEPGTGPVPAASARGAVGAEPWEVAGMGPGGWPDDEVTCRIAVSRPTDRRFAGDAVSICRRSLTSSRSTTRRARQPG